MKKIEKVIKWNVDGRNTLKAIFNSNNEIGIETTPNSDFVTLITENNEYKLSKLAFEKCVEKGILEKV